jgi:hypothetical protein
METTQIDYQGVRFSDEGIAAMVGVRQDKFVARNEINALRLKYGRAGDRTWFQAAFGLVCILGGLWLSLGLLNWLLSAGRISIGTPLGMVLLFGIGGWALWDALRSQWYFEVETSSMKRKKIGFIGAVDEAILQEFLQQARQMGYTVDVRKRARPS